MSLNEQQAHPCCVYIRSCTIKSQVILQNLGYGNQDLHVNLRTFTYSLLFMQPMKVNVTKHRGLRPMHTSICKRTFPLDLHTFLFALAQCTSHSCHWQNTPSKFLPPAVYNSLMSIIFPHHELHFFHSKVCKVFNCWGYFTGLGNTTSVFLCIQVLPPL